MEWRLHDLGEVELAKLPFETFEYQGVSFQVQAHEFGEHVTLELRRVDPPPWRVEKVVVPSSSGPRELKAFLEARGYTPLDESAELGEVVTPRICGLCSYPEADCRCVENGQR